MIENKNAEKGAFFRVTCRSAKKVSFLQKSFKKGTIFRNLFRAKGVHFATDFSRMIMSFPGHLYEVKITCRNTFDCDVID